jgi:hypothetical protein
MSNRPTTTTTTIATFNRSRFVSATRDGVDPHDLQPVSAWRISLRVVWPDF